MIDADFDFREIERGFQALERAGENPAYVFQELIPDLKADQRDHAQRRVGPDGPWPDYSQASQERRKRRRRMLGKLPSAVRYKANRDELTATSMVRWSEVHQTGGRTGRGARLPARRFLWFSESFERLAAESLEAYMQRVWGRR